MIKIAVKYGKYVFLVIAILALIYLLSVSSIFSPTPNQPNQEIDVEYNFTFELYDQNRVLIELTEGNPISNGVVDISYRNQENSTHQINIGQVGSFDIVDIRSSQDIQNLQISVNSTPVYRKSFDPQDSVESEDIQIDQIEDMNVGVDTELNLNAEEHIGNQTEYTDILWEMGDGGRYSTASATHTYTEIGTYNATLTVTDSNENVGSTEFTVEVTYGNAIGNISVPTVVNTGEPVTFSADEATTGSARQVEWVIDGVRYTERNPTVTFNESGSYIATLTALNIDGSIESESIRVIVEG